MTLAILCSGQGGQHAGMFDLTASAPQAQGLYAQASVMLGGRDPRKLVRMGSAAELHHNRTAQILCALQALAAGAALRDTMPSRLVVAGYSAGEVPSWAVAGLLASNDALELAARRAEAMDAVALPGQGLLFVRGLSRKLVDDLCRRCDVQISIVNPSDAFVLGGGRLSLIAAAAEAKAMHAIRVVVIPVEVASHTKVLAGASINFRDCLRRTEVKFPPVAGVRLLSGVDGCAVMNVEEGLDKLAAQISCPVQWADCLHACLEGGASRFLELGPGSALSTMASEQCDLPARSLENFKTLEGAKKWLMG